MMKKIILCGVWCVLLMSGVFAQEKQPTGSVIELVVAEEIEEDSRLYFKDGYGQIMRSYHQSFRLGLDYMLWDSVYIGGYSHLVDVSIYLKNVKVQSIKIKGKLHFKSYDFAILNFGLGRFNIKSNRKFCVLLGAEHRLGKSALLGVEVSVGPSGSDTGSVFYVGVRAPFSQLKKGVKRSGSVIKQSFRKKSIEFVPNESLEGPASGFSVPELVPESTESSSDKDVIRSPG